MYRYTDRIFTGAMLLLCAALVSFTPVPPHDFWWHMAVGRLVATEGIPTTNRFAWTVPLDQSYVYGQWLGGWIFYQCYQLGGPAAPVVLRNTLGLLLFGGLAWVCLQRSRSWWVTSGLLALAGWVCSTNLYLRPQVLAWLPCLLLLWMVDRERIDPSTVAPPLSAWRTPRVGRVLRLLLVPLLLAFWVNVHGSFVLGLVILGTALVGDSLTTALHLPGARPWRAHGRLALLTLLGFLATLANPLGFGVYGYVQAVAANETVRALIQEWQPPQWSSPVGASFYLAVLASLGIGLVRWRHIPLGDALRWLLLSILAIQSQRMVFWWVILTLPTIAQALGSAQVVPTPRGGQRSSAAAASSRRSGRRARPDARSVPQTAVPAPRWLHPLLLGSVGLAFLSFQPPLRGMLPWQRLLQQDVLDLPGAPGMYTTETPVAATAYLRAHPLPGRLFNDVGIGSYLMWDLPEQALFLDPRVELFPRVLWEDYLHIARAEQYQDLLIAKYGITRLVLNRQDQGTLSRTLPSDPAWQQEYGDAQIVIYRRVPVP